MTLQILELIGIVSSALVVGVFWGPWIALSRSIGGFTADGFLAIVHRMDRNLAPVMTILMPLNLLSLIAVVVISFGERPQTFALTAAGFILFVVTLLVTVLVEVPIVTQIRAWTVSTLPDDWQRP